MPSEALLQRITARTEGYAGTDPQAGPVAAATRCRQNETGAPPNIP